MRSFLLPLFLFSSVILSAQSLSIETPIRYLALGDSYTIGQSVTYQERWPRQLYDSLARLGIATDTINFIATTGWRTDDLNSGINSVAPDSNYNLVSLLIGVNNEFQGRPISQYFTEFPLLLNRAIAHAGGIKERVFVVSIPDYMFTPFGDNYPNPQIVSDALDKYNNMAKAFCDTAGITFYDITPISRQGKINPALVATDNLHPSGLQYAKWVDLLLAEQLITGLLKTSNLQANSFPNPTTDILYLPANTLSWTLTTMAGSTVLSGVKGFITTSQLPSGSYILTLKTANKIIRETVIVEAE